MKAQAALPLSDINRAHEPMYSFVVSESEAMELAAGRVPELVQRNAAWALEPVEIMVERKRRKA